MKTKLIYSIITLLLLSTGVANANIKNDTLFTSPNENTALVQQFIDSLESVDTDYIVHVKKIDNCTNKTLYSNYILWAKLFVKDTNKYGVKELDELIYHDNIISIEENNYSRKLETNESFFRFLNIHKDTFFENDSFITIPFSQSIISIIQVKLNHNNKTLSLEFPCELDFNSKYYSELSGSLLYPIYLLVNKEIASYIDIQDFYTRLYGNKEENEADDFKDQIRNAKFKMKYNEELLQRVKSFIYDKSNDTINKEFVVYTPLPNWEKTDSLFVDSLCRSGVEDIIVDYKHMGWSWNDHPDTTNRATGFTTEIIWCENNSNLAKVKIFSKLFETPVFILKTQLFNFLDFNTEIISDSVLKSFNNYKESNLWRKEDSLIKVEKEFKRKRRELEILNGDFPINYGDTIVVYGDIVEPNKINVTTDGGSLSDTYNLFYNGFETMYSTLWFSDENYKYLFKEYTGSGLYTLELLLDKFIDDFFEENLIYFADCKTNKLNNEETKKYWLNEIERIEKDIDDYEKFKTELENDLKQLQSENNSK